MTDRTFQQYAQGYGSIPCQAVYQINGNTVFSGTVMTLDQYFPVLPNPADSVENLAWSWTNVPDFEGTQQITISVTGSDMLLGPTLANNPAVDPDVFGAFYINQQGGIGYPEPFSDVAIDGELQPHPFDPQNPGQWWWHIPAGATFSATMHVTAPSVRPS